MRSGQLPWKAAALAIAVLAIAARLLPVSAWLRDFESWIAQWGAAGMLVYGAAYVAAVLLFVPGIVMTLGAGFLFGVFRGTILVSAASTAAATLAFLIGRHVARERFERLARENPRFAALDRAIGREGWKVVALLRLSPLVPFSLSNYLYGLTRVRLGPYALSSWIAMLPATVLYVSIGAAGRAIGEGRARGPWEWGLFAAGLAATAAVTALLTRAAKREMAKTRDSA